MTRISKKQPPEMFYNKGIIRNFPKFTGTRLCWSLCNFVKKETLTKVFSYEFWEIFKKVFSNRTPPGDCFFTAHALPVYQPSIYQDKKFQ